MLTLQQRKKSLTLRKTPGEESGAYRLCRVAPSKQVKTWPELRRLSLLPTLHYDRRKSLGPANIELVSHKRHLVKLIRAISEW